MKGLLFVLPEASITSKVLSFRKEERRKGEGEEGEMRVQGSGREGWGGWRQEGWEPAVQHLL